MSTVKRALFVIGLVVFTQSAVAEVAMTDVEAPAQAVKKPLDGTELQARGYNNGFYGPNGHCWFWIGKGGRTRRQCGY